MSAMILAAGSNYYGQLGIGSTVRDNNSILIHFGTCDEFELSMKDVADIACGGQMSVVIHKNGKVSVTHLLYKIIYHTPADLYFSTLPPVYRCQCVDI